jgi:hypothetical protein
MASRARGLAQALLLAAGAGAVPAFAQQVDVPVSAAARCLTVREGAAEAPVYPFDEFKLDRRGAVQVLLRFDAPDAPPILTVQESHGGDAFVDAVRTHAKELRVPCLQPGEGPARLIRDYIFRPDDQHVHWFRAVDATAREHREALRCVGHLKGEETPAYPIEARRVELQGRVIAEMRFDASDRPPVLTVHARPAARELARAVERWARDLRMPCHPGGVITGNWTYVYLLEGGEVFGFRNVPFRSLLASTQGIQQQRLDFDTRQMGCPFEVDFHYRQPRLRNRIGEVGETNAARRPLLEWMESIVLDLPSNSLDSVYGDSTRITVPCARIDLKPKE